MQPTGNWNRPCLATPTSPGDWLVNVMHNPHRSDMCYRTLIKGSAAMPKIIIFNPKDVIEEINLGPLKAGVYIYNNTFPPYSSVLIILYYSQHS